MKEYISKPGKHGTLYRYGIDYTAGEGSPLFRWRTWAYDAAHAWENWRDAEDLDGGGWDTHGTFTREVKRD